MLLARGFLDGLGITLQGLQFVLEAPGLGFRFTDVLLQFGLLPFEADTLDDTPVPEKDKPDQGKTNRQHGKKPFVPEKAENLLRVKPALFLSVEEIVHG
jgi:hypothetical protein